MTSTRGDALGAGAAQPPDLDGPMLSRITNGIGHLHAEHYGKGPSKARSYLVADMLICVLHDACTPAERLLIANGEADEIQCMRVKWQRAMQPQLHEIVESAAGRRVLASMSQISPETGVHLDVFFLA